MSNLETFPIRLSRADRAALRAAAYGRPVWTWLRELGLEEARRRSSAQTVADLLGEKATNAIRNGRRR